jgi:hypothetical protein
MLHATISARQLGAHYGRSGELAHFSEADMNMSGLTMPMASWSESSLSRDGMRHTSVSNHPLIHFWTVGRM